jgi:subtilase family serine protease
MRNVLFSWLIVSVLFSTASYGQISKGGNPKSFYNHKLLSSSVVVPELSFASIDEKTLLNEDDKNAESGTPFRFGVPFYVNHTLENSGKWDALPNGDRIWRLTLKSTGAYSINLIFDQYNLPEGAELFIYNADRSMVIGAFTSENNQADGKFGVQPVKGDQVTIEYYEPTAVKGQGVLSIAEVIHAYRNLFEEAYGFGNASSCHINVNCALGASWQNQKRAVALIVAGGALCSGAMVNNTAQDGKPYLLTANHCFSGSVSTWVYVFNYESPNCTDTEGPSNQTVSGSSLRARYADSDFLLVELNNIPPASYNVHYAGWSKAATAPGGVTAIHHPAGDIKKISNAAATPITNDWNGSGIFSHWQLSGWDNGTVEGGSSGSPLFDQNGKIVGQLHGGSVPVCPGSGKISSYGKFDYSWATGPTSADRLKEWLDPGNTGVTSLNGADLSTLVHYCTSSASSAVAGLIAEVDFGTISNVSGTSCAAYTDFTSVSTNVTPGTSIPLSVTAGTCGTNNTKYVKVFIDWNADFDFNDFGELVATSGAITSSTPFTTNVSIPSNAIPGTSTRMRVVCMDTPAAANVLACGSYTSGETEDYTINISQGSIYTLPVSGFSSITTCSGVLYDDGGASGDYSDNCNGSITINPSVAGNKVSLSFTSFSIETCCDILYIYNGANTSAPLIGAFTTNPGTIYASNASGALTVLLSSDGTVDYSGIQANISCVSTPPPADLITQNQDAAPTAVSSGGAIGLTCDVYNQGGTTATSSNIGYYLSTNNVWDAADVYLSNSSGGSLSNGISSTKTASVTIPVGTAIGNYYILYFADYSGLITEADETNNVTSFQIAVVAPSVDLIIQSPTTTLTSLTPGSTVSLGCSIVNQGTTNSTSSYVGYYLSANATWDASDVLLGSSNGGALGNGASASTSASLTIPGSTTPGPYYILYYADYSSIIGETDETNNVVSIAVTVINAYLVPFSGTSSITTCSGSVFDNGGTSNYSDNAYGTLTIYPSTAGNHIKLNFTSFSVEGFYDYLYIYDGTSTSATLIGTYTGNNSPGIVYASNASGALTIRFVSDYVVNYPGFEAAISCVTSVPQADLIILTPSATPLSVLQGGSMSVSSYIQNQGGATASSSNVDFYLSSDNIWDAADTYLGYYYGGTLGGGASGYRGTSVTIPSGTPTGSYYILFYADYLNNTIESNETNNVSSVAITVASAAVDLIIQTPAVTPSTLAAGNNLSASCYVYNQGNSYASYSYLGYYLSTNATWDASDVLLSYNYTSGLYALNSYYNSSSLTIPVGTAPGGYYILFYTDIYNFAAETNETNNVNSVAITVVAPSIDLIVQTPVLGSSSVPAGNSVAANCYVYNQGLTVSPYSYTGYYLSSNATWDAADVLLTYTTTYSLNGGSSLYNSASLSIPSGTTPGSYYILFYADYSGLVSETNETNNVSSIAITVIAPTIDLIVQTPTVTTTTLASGNSTSATCYVYNQGNSYASYSSTGYFLSTNATWDAADISLAASYTSGLNSAGSYYNSTAITIPAGTTPGAYYILFYADIYNYLTEANETNNVSSVAITVIAPSIDLIIQTPSLGSSSVPVGGSASASCYTRNQGATSSPSSSTGYYLSTNTTWDAADIFLSYSNISALATNSSYYGSTTFSIPAGTATGAYYILYFADYASNISETNETNNVSSLPITVTAASVDLIVQSPSMASSVNPGSYLYVSYYIYNQGTTSSTSNYTGFYLSSNSTWDAGDVYLSSTYAYATSGGYSDYGSTYLTIPSGTTVGNYYILFYADYLNTVSETNETNNVYAVPVSVAVPSVDLIIQTPSLPASSVTAGSSINATCYVYNQGTNYASSSYTGFYLSTDATLSVGDVYLTQAYTSGISGGYTGYDNVYLTIPYGTAPGSYYILFCADYSSYVSESNETNNVSSIPIGIGIQPTADLIIQSPSLATSVVSGGMNLLTSCNVHNQGLYAAVAGYLGYYLSRDTIWDASDFFLDFLYTSTIIPGGSVYGNSSNLFIPNTIVPGYYYIIFYADYKNSQLENDESNNTRALPIYMTTGIEEAADINSSISIYPNPTIGAFSVNISKAYTETGKITILNAVGEEVLTRALVPSSNGSLEKFQMETAAGLYTVKIEIGDNVVFKKISIEK